MTIKLYLNETSPFARVVLATALLCDGPQLTLEWVDPWQSPADLANANPFCIIPTIELADGTALIESLAICQYLIETYSPSRLRAVDYRNAEQVAIIGFAKTMMESAFRSVALERFIGAGNPLSERAKSGLLQAVSKLEQQLAADHDAGYLQPNLAILYLHTALDYVAFRHRELFDCGAGQHVAAFLAHSPFVDALAQVSVQRLSSRPNFWGNSNKLNID
ncbi:glutathione S-transferase family protein [Serratia microhaemolytica]|uniref:glutathione S-transferase family protein n=1 Tax=Serratia microhaemolytica TaxID=2675110 RepID=UPI00197ED38E|nr:glutathione S-transferase N-terminal domain-containing protein [Serratia microhaemolytica]